MSRTPIFSQIFTFQHPQQIARLDPRAFLTKPENGPLIRPEFERFLGTYPTAHVGAQIVNLNPASGLSYDGSSVITLPPSSVGAGVSIVDQPTIGSNGNQKLTVNYTIPPGGEIRFRVRAYAQPTADPRAGNVASEHEILYL